MYSQAGMTTLAVCDISYDACWGSGSSQWQACDYAGLAASPGVTWMKQDPRMMSRV